MSYDLPLHLTLTGRPLLLYPAIVPELHQRLQASYEPRAARLFNRAKRRKAKKPKADSNIKSNPNVTARAHRYALSQNPAQIQHDPYIDHITVSGPLLNKAEYFDGMLCVDGYDRIEAAFARAIADTDCAGILFEIDSPGGIVSGCFELSEKIQQWAAIKPITVHCGGLLCSAAYSLAAGCTQIIAQRTALIGSIGVVYGRLDVTAMNKKEGVKIDFIKSGDQKTWGNPETPMDDAELAAHQTEVMQLANMFFEGVAAGRGMDIAAIQDLQAGTFLTQIAIDHGLADDIGDLAFALSRTAELAQSHGRDAPQLETEISETDIAASSDAAQSNPKASTSQSKFKSKFKSKFQPAAPAVQSTIKETPMSKFKRGALRATLALTATTMAKNAMATHAMGDDEIDAMEDDELKKAVDEEAQEEVEAMDDDEVKAMNDEIEAMDDNEIAAMEDDEIEAMDEDELEAMDEDDEAMKDAKFKASASRIAHRAIAQYRRAHPAALAPAALAPAKSGKANTSHHRRDVNAAVKAERSRVAAIQALPEAGRNPSLAAHFIAEGTSLKSAKAGLKAAAKNQPANRLSSVHNPNIGTGSGQASSSKSTGLDQALKAEQARKAAKIHGAPAH